MGQEVESLFQEEERRTMATGWKEVGGCAGDTEELRVTKRMAVSGSQQGRGICMARCLETEIGRWSAPTE